MSEMTEAAIPKLAPQRRAPLEIGVDRVWRFFCSVRAAVWEVAILALLVLVGTLRGSEVPQWIADLVPPLQGFVDRWYRWDVFHSLPFAFILGLLAVAIMICTLNRAPAMWISIAEPTISTTSGFLNSAELQLRSTQPAHRDAIVNDLRTALEASHYRVLTTERNGDTHVYADRYRYGKLGTFPFHLALILVLVGGIVGSRYGFREKSFIVAEGASQDVGHNTGLSVQLVDFQDTYTELGQAHEYRSDLVISRDGDVVKRGSITVNHPISYRSTVIYQSSFGPAMQLRVTDAAGAPIYEGSVPLVVDLFAKGNSDAPAGKLDLLSQNRTLFVIGPDSDPANAPELDKLNLQSGQMYLEIHDLENPGSAGTALTLEQGVPATVSGLTYTFLRESQWSGMQISHNPGIPIFWAAALMLIGGLAVVFYFPHRRIRGIVTGGEQATALIAPMARRDWSARRTFEQFAERMNERFPGEWALSAREDGLQFDGYAADTAT